MTTSASRLSALTLALALLGGCATTGPAAAPPPAVGMALSQLDAGQPREAALALETAAAGARGATRSQWLADAAWAWELAGDAARARQVAAGVNPRHLAGASLQRWQLVQARLALADGQPAQALAQLATPLSALHAPLRTPWLLTRSRAQEATGDLMGAAASRLPLLANADRRAREEQQRAIARLLAGLDDAALQAGAAALAAGDPLYNHAGRALLARGLPLPRPLDVDPLALPDLGRRAAAERDGYRPAARVAVLLPLSGQLATAAEPVRDGLLAGYYAESRRRPVLEFLDTRGTPAGALAAYDRAVDSGADYVIGPLGRDEVDALFARSELPVPVQALNHGNGLPPPGHLAFSLAPEDDGLMAADYLLSRERRAAVVLHSNDETGRRAAEAFAGQFGQRGGRVLASVAISDNPADISAQLPAGADAVFLAVRAPQARALAPQLALAGLAGASRVGTSQLASGLGRPGEDAVLDGIAFPTERWQVTGTAGLPPAGSLAQRLPTARGGAARLLAFGFDAWQISAYPERLAGNHSQPLAGATGTLYLDGAGKVLRRPAWSVISGGQLRPLPDGR